MVFFHLSIIVTLFNGFLEYRFKRCLLHVLRVINNTSTMSICTSYYIINIIKYLTVELNAIIIYIIYSLNLLSMLGPTFGNQWCYFYIFFFEKLFSLNAGTPTVAIAYYISSGVRSEEVRFVSHRHCLPTTPRGAQKMKQEIGISKPNVSGR